MLALALLVAWCERPAFSERYCEHLVETARSESLQSALKAWVDQHPVPERIGRKDVIPDVFWPGLYWRLAFDGESLGLGPDAHARLVGPYPGNWVDDTVAEAVESIYFGEIPRHGILVRLPGSVGFGVDETFLFPISEDIAVLCRERD